MPESFCSNLAILIGGGDSYLGLLYSGNSASVFDLKDLLDFGVSNNLFSLISNVTFFSIFSFLVLFYPVLPCFTIIDDAVVVFEFELYFDDWNLFGSAFFHSAIR